MALTQLKTGAIADDAVTTDKLANAINTERTANTAKVSLDADSVTGAKIADDAVGAEHIEQLDADLSFADSAKAKFGAGNDLQLYHDGTDSYVANTTGTLYILPKSGENGIQLVPDGAVRLYYDNSKKLETSDYGTWLGDNSRITLGGSAGTPDCHFYHDGTDTNLQNITGDLVIKSTSGGAKAIVAKNGGAVELYHNNTKKFETTSLGTQTFGDAQFEGNDGTDNALKWDKSDDSLYFRDNYKAQFGTGGDLQIYHDGTASRIHSGSHPLYMRTGGQWGVFKGDGSESMIVAEPDGEVKLYYDNTKFLETSADGVKIGTGSAGRLEVNSGAAELAWWNDNTADGTYIKFWQTSSGANTIGSISHNSTSTSYNTSSDYRLKENATAISDGITRLKTLKPYRFNFKVTPKETVDGFFAHEVTAVPEAITGTKDQVDADGNIDPQSIDQSKLVPLLTAALQEAVAKIETLETKVAALETG